MSKTDFDFVAGLISTKTSGLFTVFYSWVLANSEKFAFLFTASNTKLYYPVQVQNLGLSKICEIFFY